MKEAAFEDLEENGYIVNKDSLRIIFNPETVAFKKIDPEETNEFFSDSVFRFNDAVLALNSRVHRSSTFSFFLPNFNMFLILIFQKSYSNINNHFVVDWGLLFVLFYLILKSSHHSNTNFNLQIILQNQKTQKSRSLFRRIIIHQNFNSFGFPFGITDVLALNFRQ